MKEYTPTLTPHDEFLDGLKIPATAVASSLAVLGTFTVVVNITPQGERFTKRQELGFDISDLDQSQASLIETHSILLDNSSDSAAQDVSEIIQSNSDQIAEVKAERDNLGNAYVDNTELIGSAIMIGALVGTVVYRKINAKVQRRAPNYRPY